VYGNDNVDWYDALYKKGAFSQEHSLSISGGNDMNSYYLSGNYMDQAGLLKLGEDGLKRYTATAKIASQIASWAKIDYSGKFTRLETTRPQTSRGQHDFWFAEQAWPTLPLYDPNGYYYFAPSAALAMAEGGTNDYTSDRNTHQLGLTLEPIKDWKIIGNLNYAVTDEHRKYVVNTLYNHNVAGGPVLREGGNSIQEFSYKTNYFNADIRSEFKKTLNKEHNFMLMGGFQAEKSKYRDLTAKKAGVITNGMPSIDTSTGFDEWGGNRSPEVSGKYINWSTAGFFGRLNYDYMGKYLFEANIRYDGTSRFRSDKRWNWFPSVSLGWNIAQESFWDNLRNSVEALKLRASWGKLGNQNTNSYYPTYSAMNLGYNNGDWLVNGVRPNTAAPAPLVSYALTWEKIKTYNLGLDVSALKNRLVASFDTYIRYTNDMVGPAIDLPVVLGTRVPNMNNTDLKTSGFEFEIAWRDKLSNGLGYNVRFNVSDSRTKIIKYPNDANLLGFEMAWSGYINYARYRNGERYGEIWGYKTVGIAKTQAEMDAHLTSMSNGAQNALGTNWGAGDIMYKDLNGDGKVDAGSRTIDDHGDLKVIGNITPRYIFGINLGADYKGVDMSMFFQGVMKRDYFIGSYLFWGSNGRSMWDATCFNEHLDYFRDDANHPFGENLNSYYPRPLYDENGVAKNYEVQTKYLQNASYIRLKMLQVGYSLPQPVLNKLKLQKLRVYVSGENLWTGTKLSKIFDPELIDNPDSGGAQYPLSKVFSLGINMTF
jgi:TonB-linked SusC/RagA family outer membrane protein